MGSSTQIVKLNNGTCFKISGKMTDKMDNIRSLNTSHLLNANCQANKLIENCICKHCYSKRTEDKYLNTRVMYADNYKVLSTYTLSKNEIPKLKDEIFRFNAHGDLVNRRHYLNLVKIAKYNPQTKFALWTKNLDVVFSGKGIILLDNLTYIYSDLFVNNIDKPIVPDNFDKIFRVYNLGTIRKHNLFDKINCSKSCYACQLCYRKNKVKIINEQLKSSSK
jgi:hypothetical protein